MTSALNTGTGDSPWRQARSLHGEAALRQCGFCDNRRKLEIAGAIV
jgi:hypothetical protein